MKKIYLLLAFVLHFLSGCSSDSSESYGGLLLKQVHSASISEGTINFYYHGHKIDYQASSDGWKAVYIYTGNLITNIKFYEGSDFTGEQNFIYDTSERLIKVTYSNYFNDLVRITDYTYNDDNTITSETNDAVFSGQQYGKYKYYLDSTGKCNKIDTWNFFSLNWVTEVEISYDTFQNPYNNIIGYDKIYVISNTINLYETFKRYDLSGSLTSSFASEYTINEANYPIHEIQTVTQSNNDVIVVNIDYTYY